jgi:hypothetical protein
VVGFEVLRVVPWLLGLTQYTSKELCTGSSRGLLRETARRKKTAACSITTYYSYKTRLHLVKESQMETSSSRHRALKAAALLGAAIVLAALIWRPFAMTTADEAVTVSGLGNSGNTFYMPGPALARGARRAVELGLSPRIPDDELRRVIESLRERALRGESDAAAFVIELAAAERAKEARAVRPAESR